MSNKSLVAVASFLAITCTASPGHGFGIRPMGNDNQETIYVKSPHVSWMPPGFDKYLTNKYSIPAHERVTNIIFGCKDDKRDPEKCSAAAADAEDAVARHLAPPAVLAGAEWNDNPPFELLSTNDRFCKPYVHQVIRAPYALECWYTLFYDAEKGASEKNEYYDVNSGKILLYRVHFGDMQFLHSMASKDGETAKASKENIMMWAEFTYKVATGSIDRGTALQKTGIDGLVRTFGNERYREWTVQQLFIQGDNTYDADADFRDFAFGSLLHLVQDGFSRSHVSRKTATGEMCAEAAGYRKPGKIIQFHSYAHQDKKSHSKEDTQDAVSVNLSKDRPTVVDVGMALKNYYQQNKPWEEVQKYLDCVYDLEDPNSAAGPGNDDIVGQN